MIGIYKITNPLGKIYIGQSVNIDSRFRRYRNLECKSQHKLYNSLKKYGIENHSFEILIECDFDQLNELERYYQDLYNVIKNGLNCILTRTDIKKGVMSKETRDKISKSNTGKKCSDETKKKLSDFNTGRTRTKKINPINPPKIKVKRVQSEETKMKIRNSLLGKKRPEHIGKLISEKLKGRKLSEEHKLKISMNSSKNNLGKKLSQETINKISLNSKLKRKLLDTKTNIIYDSILEASIMLNIGYSKLRAKMSGVNKNDTTLIYLHNGRN